MFYFYFFNLLVSYLSKLLGSRIKQPAPGILSGSCTVRRLPPFTSSTHTTHRDLSTLLPSLVWRVALSSLCCNVSNRKSQASHEALPASHRMGTRAPASGSIYLDHKVNRFQVPLQRSQQLMPPGEASHQYHETPDPLLHESASFDQA